MSRRHAMLGTELRERTLRSEELLLLAVLEQAVADLDNPCAAVRADADAYIYNYGDDYSLFSFDAVCTYFRLSPSAVRESLRDRPERRRRRPAHAHGGQVVPLRRRRREPRPRLTCADLVLAPTGT